MEESPRTRPRRGFFSDVLGFLLHAGTWPRWVGLSLGLMPVLFLAGWALVGCAPQSATERLTLGTVQATLHEGLSQAEVQAALGAPNIISRDSSGREVWTYDKVSKQATSRYLLFWASTEATQRTLTVLITFDKNGRVLEYSYHSMEF